LTRYVLEQTSSFVCETLHQHLEDKQSEPFQEIKESGNSIQFEGSKAFSRMYFVGGTENDLMSRLDVREGQQGAR
jgi:hypothetical protein